MIDWVYPEWNRRLLRLLATEVSWAPGLNFGCHRCSARRSVLISTAALKELAMAIPAAPHKVLLACDTARLCASRNVATIPERASARSVELRLPKRKINETAQITAI